MYRFAFAFFTLAAVGLAHSSVHAQGKLPKGGEGKFGWLPSLQEGKQQASQTGKPIMAVVRCVP